MSQEHMREQIRMALDMLQIITEDVEDTFLCKNVEDSAVRARATMTISALYVLTDYLRGVAEGAAVPHSKGNDR